jgi:hypothetical protein
MMLLQADELMRWAAEMDESAPLMQPWGDGEFGG